MSAFYPLSQQDVKLLSKFRGDGVYVICHQGLMKVGYSHFPISRVRRHLKVYPEAYVVGCADGSMKDEKAVHKRLRNQLVRDEEWFRASPFDLVQAFADVGLDLDLADWIDPNCRVYCPLVEWHLDQIGAFIEDNPNAAQAARDLLNRGVLVEEVEYWAAKMRLFVASLRRMQARETSA